MARVKEELLARWLQTAPTWDKRSWSMAARRSLSHLKCLLHLRFGSRQKSPVMVNRSSTKGQPHTSSGDTWKPNEISQNCKTRVWCVQDKLAALCKVRRVRVMCDTTKAQILKYRPHATSRKFDTKICWLNQYSSSWIKSFLNSMPVSLHFGLGPTTRRIRDNARFCQKIKHLCTFGSRVCSGQRTFSLLQKVPCCGE